MSQQSEERVAESAQSEADEQHGARILHLKSRHYDLQRAIQQRAQEAMDREAALDKEQRRPKPLKWLVVMSIAAIPAVLTLAAVDGFLKVFHKYLGVVTAEIEQQQREAEAAEAAAMPIQTEAGVVILQSVPADTAAPPQPVPTPDSKNDSKN